MIKYVPHTNIDKERWDACITGSGNEFIYACSWYLDIVSPGWDALILDDYYAIMPLTWSEKWKIKYLYPPLFTQQLGIFSTNRLSPEQVEGFIHAIPEKFRYLQINLNEFNPLSENPGFEVCINNNHEIDLSDSYENLYANFNRNCKRNINKAFISKLTVHSNLPTKSFVMFVKDNLELRLKMLERKDYNVLENLINNILTRKSGEIYGAYSADGELCGVALFLITARRCIFSVCASSAYGKQFQAMYLLVCNQVKKYAGSGKIFDFSGSNIPGIAYFNSTFGSAVKNYPSVILNRLPWPLRIFKK